jgi:tRNA-specific adenosine deaminase 3
MRFFTLSSNIPKIGLLSFPAFKIFVVNNEAHVEKNVPFCMARRLQSFEEERAVELVEGRAVRVSKGELAKRIRTFSHCKLPRHLKRIKGVGDELLVLVSVEEAEDSGTEKTEESNEMEIVKVPKNQPITDEQYRMSILYWPCNRAHRVSERISQEYVSSMRDRIMGENEDAMLMCSGVCIISSEDGFVSVYKDRSDFLGHSILQAIESVSRMEVSYLCTGLDAFIYREPCLSCAAALVHGRIRRVFMVEEGRGLRPYSQLKLNYNKSLNHRYDVYYI